MRQRAEIKAGSQGRLDGGVCREVDWMEPAESGGVQGASDSYLPWLAFGLPQNVGADIKEKFEFAKRVRMH